MIYPLGATIWGVPEKVARNKWIVPIFNEWHLLLNGVNSPHLFSAFVHFSTPVQLLFLSLTNKALMKLTV